MLTISRKLRWIIFVWAWILVAVAAQIVIEYSPIGYDSGGFIGLFVVVRTTYSDPIKARFGVQSMGFSTSDLVELMAGAILVGVVASAAIALLGPAGRKARKRRSDTGTDM